MKIAIDALGISRPGGGRSATLNLLHPLLHMDGINEYVVFLDEHEPCLEPYANIRQVLAPTKNRLAVRLWAQTIWPSFLKREHVDVIHFTKNLTTLTPCPSLVTVHDLTVLVHPDFFPRTDHVYWRTVGGFGLRHVDHVIAVSGLTADDVVVRCHVPRDRVTVVHEGIDSSFRPSPGESMSRIWEKYGLPESYLLHVGSIWPKKNLSTLARAYLRLVREGDYAGGLVLAGAPYLGRGDPELTTLLAANESGTIVLTGPVAQEDLAALYSGADCFVFPSLHEGFGLVPLEAAACGTPVISARVGAVEEVLGNAAEYVADQRSDIELADRISRVLEHPLRRDEMCKLGQTRVKALSRERAAALTLDLYLQTA